MTTKFEHPKESLFRFPVAAEVLVKWMDEFKIYPLTEDGSMPIELVKRVNLSTQVDYVCRRPEWCEATFLQHKPSRKTVWDLAVQNTKALQKIDWRYSEGNKVVSNKVDLANSYLGMFTGEIIPFYSKEFYKYASQVTWDEAKGELFEASLHFLLGYFAANGEAMGYLYKQFQRPFWNFIQPIAS